MSKLTARPIWLIQANQGSNFPLVRWWPEGPSYEPSDWLESSYVPLQTTTIVT